MSTELSGMSFKPAVKSQGAKFHGFFSSMTEESISKSIFYAIPLVCHSGLSGIFLCFQKDSRRASLAGMTLYMQKPILR
jgi:hypothetical protein